MKIPDKETIEMVVFDKLLEKSDGVTIDDFHQYNMTEDDLAGIIENIRKISREDEEIASCYSHELMCRLISIDVISEYEIAMFFPKANCSDMMGAIKVATAINRNVSKISTYSDYIADTSYYKKDGCWYSSDSCGELPVDKISTH